MSIVDGGKLFVRGSKMGWIFDRCSSGEFCGNAQPALARAAKHSAPSEVRIIIVPP
jgi:hypothetical protein